MRLFAAVPTHGGTMVVETAKALVLVQKMALGRGWDFELHCEFGSTVSLVRNALAAAFLKSGAELLLMLDADQAVGADTIARMADLNKPVVGCLYPKRSYDWSKLRLEGITNADQLRYRVSNFIGSLVTTEDGKAQFEKGFARAKWVGTGVLLVQRDAFQRLMDHFPELRGRGFGPDAYPEYNDTGRWGFFNPMDNEEGVPLSEDISFCRRWEQAGGEIWADIASNVLHVGPNVHSGNYLDYFRANVIHAPVS